MIENRASEERIFIRDLDKLVEKKEVKVETKYLVFAGVLVLIMIPLTFFAGYNLGGIEEFRANDACKRLIHPLQEKEVRTIKVDNLSGLLSANELKRKRFVTGSVIPAGRKAENGTGTEMEIRLIPRRDEFPAQSGRIFSTAKLSFPIEKAVAAVVDPKAKEPQKIAAVNKGKLTAKETVKNSAIGTNRYPIYSVQVRSYHDPALAEEFAAELKKKGYQAEISEFVNQSGEKYYRVRIGTYREIEQAKGLKTKLLEKEGFDSMVISLK